MNNKDDTARMMLLHSRHLTSDLEPLVHFVVVTTLVSLIYSEEVYQQEMSVHL